MIWGGGRGSKKKRYLVALLQEKKLRGSPGENFFPPLQINSGRLLSLLQTEHNSLHPIWHFHPSNPYKDLD